MGQRVGPAHHFFSFLTHFRLAHGGPCWAGGRGLIKESVHVIVAESVERGGNHERIGGCSHPERRCQGQWGPDS